MTTHAPGRLPPITLNGRSFYIRSGGLSYLPVAKDVTSSFAVSGARRRSVFSKPREWLFTIACRSWDERYFLEALVNDMDYSSYSETFEDGITEGSYEVIILEMGEFETVQNNTDYWDVTVRLGEWA